MHGRQHLGVRKRKKFGKNYWKLPVWKIRFQKILQMHVEYSANRMEIDLFVHKVPSQNESFGRLKASLFNSNFRFGRIVTGLRQYPKRVYQTVMVKFSVCDTRVVGISKQIVHSIRTKIVAHNDLRQDVLPYRECNVFHLLLADSDLRDMFSLQRRYHGIPNSLHVVRLDDFDRYPLMIPSNRKQSLCGMRKWKVADIMAKRSHSKNAPPVLQLSGRWK